MTGTSSLAVPFLSQYHDPAMPHAPGFTCNAILVGRRKDNFGPVYYKQLNQDFKKIHDMNSKPPKLCLLHAPRATEHDKRNPMEGEVMWLPFFNPMHFESTEKRERDRLQRWFVYLAWLSVIVPDFGQLDNPFNRTGCARWQQWWDQEGIPLRKEIARRRRGFRRYVKNDKGEFVPDPEDDEGYHEGHSEHLGDGQLANDELREPTGPPPKPQKRKSASEHQPNPRNSTENPFLYQAAGVLDSLRRDSGIDSEKTPRWNFARAGSAETDSNSNIGRRNRFSRSPMFDPRTPETLSREGSVQSVDHRSNVHDAENHPSRALEPGARRTQERIAEDIVIIENDTINEDKTARQEIKNNMALLDVHHIEGEAYQGARRRSATSNDRQEVREDDDAELEVTTREEFERSKIIATEAGGRRRRRDNGAAQSQELTKTESNDNDDQEGGDEGAEDSEESGC